MKRLGWEHTGNDEFELRPVGGIEPGDAVPIDGGRPLPYRPSGRPVRRDWERWEIVENRENEFRERVGAPLLTWETMLIQRFGIEPECPVCHGITRIVVWSDIPPEYVRCAECEKLWRLWLYGENEEAVA